MKHKGKSVKTEQDNSNLCSDSNYFSSSYSVNLCKKHPLNPSSVGICAYCLNEKLIKLICSDCGEQRLSSCSCSDISSYRNSSCTGDVGRISFLIENEKRDNGDEQKTLFSHMKKTKQSETEDVVLLKRSNSCVAEGKKNNGFWRIGKLFKKKREKECCSERNICGFDEKNEFCVMDVSRSRSISSFMDGNYESAKVSDFNEFDPIKTGIRGGWMDSERSTFSIKETNFRKMNDVDDDDEFIDLNIDLCEKSKAEHSVFKKYDQLESSSCRFMVNDRGIKKVENSHMKAWKWGFKHHSGKKEVNHMLDS